MNPLLEMTVADVLWAPIIVGIIAALKKAGWAGDARLVYTALALGPLLVVGWWGGFPGDAGYTVPGAVLAIYTGLIASLISMGTYKAGQRFLGNGGFQPRGER